MSNYVRELTLQYERKVSTDPFVGTTLNNPQLVALIAHKLIGQSAVEQFLIFHVDARNAVKSYQKIGLGGVNQCAVSRPEIFKGALLANASAIIATHNHPSGACQPSVQDDELTSLIAQGAEMLGFDFLDHLIVTDEKENYFSYAREKPGYLHTN